MKQNLIGFLGILGVSLLLIATILGAILIEDYNSFSQYMSESYAIDTEYGVMLRTFFYIPSGILTIVFSLMAIQYFPNKKMVKWGFIGMAVFYGLGTLMVGFFPCDSGCNPELIDPSVSQIIHNLVGFLTYVFTPVCILFIGFGLRKIEQYRKTSNYALQLGFMSLVVVFVLFSNPLSGSKGLLQRIIEVCFGLAICLFAFRVKKSASPIKN